MTAASLDKRDAEKAVNARFAGRYFRAGLEPADHGLRPRRNLAGLRVSAGVEVEAGDDCVADWAEHDGDACAAVRRRPGLRFVVRRPGAGVVDCGRVSGSRVDRDPDRSSVADLRL